MRALAPVALAVIAGLSAPASVAALHDELFPRGLPPPRYRIELVGPLVGGGAFYAPASAIERGIAAASFELRFADRSGHGALVRVISGAALFSGSGRAAELAYLHRLRLAGDDRVGLGLDLSSGPTLAVIVHENGAVPAGNATGWHVGASMDLRLLGLTISVAAQYRALVPWHGPADGGAPDVEHAWTITGGFGLALYAADTPPRLPRPPPPE